MYQNDKYMTILEKLEKIEQEVARRTSELFDDLKLPKEVAELMSVDVKIERDKLVAYTGLKKNTFNLLAEGKRKTSTPEIDQAVAKIQSLYDSLNIKPE